MPTPNVPTLFESPKKRFQKTAAAKTHAQLVVSDAFITACDMAMLQMQEGFASDHDDPLAYGKQMMMSGAIKFRNTLLRLSEPDAPPRSRPNDNLNP